MIHGDKEKGAQRSSFKSRIEITAHTHTSPDRWELGQLVSHSLLLICIVFNFEPSTLHVRSATRTWHLAWSVREPATAKPRAVLPDRRSRWSSPTNQLINRSPIRLFRPHHLSCNFPIPSGSWQPETLSSACELVVAPCPHPYNRRLAFQCSINHRKSSLPHRPYLHLHPPLTQ